MSEGFYVDALEEGLLHGLLAELLDHVHALRVRHLLLLVGKVGKEGRATLRGCSTLRTVSVARPPVRAVVDHAAAERQERRLAALGLEGGHAPNKEEQEQGHWSRAAARDEFRILSQTRSSRDRDKQHTAFHVVHTRLLSFYASLGCAVHLAQGRVLLLREGMERQGDLESAGGRALALTRQSTQYVQHTSTHAVQESCTSPGTSVA